MLGAQARRPRDCPDAVIEWYARVLYSSRENFFRKQYFQFRDLFKEEFLYGQKTGAKCYCRCRLMPDRRSELGWGVVIEEIRPATWKEILTVVDGLGRTDLDDPALFSTT
ncbi:hypothetical protein CDD83_2699 [Cordyceps sp. RAO-2017]|nr:hypothetical protein CDD83_2699 [Cordyceps sp. RAO-2017]